MNVVATRAAEGFPRRSFTVAEIRRMGEAGIIAEDENFELVDGELVARFTKGNEHEIIKAALGEFLAREAPDDLRALKSLHSQWLVDVMLARLESARSCLRSASSSGRSIAWNSKYWYSLLARPPGTVPAAASSSPDSSGSRG